jgi:long-subunit acyl-CoA synthetase (AMP-forming)
LFFEGKEVEPSIVIETPTSVSPSQNPDSFLPFLCSLPETKTFMLAHVREILQAAKRKGYEIPSEIHLTRFFVLSLIIIFFEAIEFTVENEQLTPSLKIRRDKLKKDYFDIIETMAKKLKVAD